MSTVSTIEAIPRTDQHPTRVVIDTDGYGVTRMEAVREYNIAVDIIFMRDDGWSLGAPFELADVAFKMWADSWCGVWVRGQRTFTLFQTYKKEG